jgi:hypothetical protein
MLQEMSRLEPSKNRSTPHNQIIFKVYLSIIPYFGSEADRKLHMQS